MTKWWMTHLWRVASWAAAAMLLGCGAGLAPLTLPPAPSPAVSGGSGVLRAGFGRADITPPPGIGLGGYSFEGQQAIGYRHRLFVRAMVLEGPDGERVAMVVADLPQVSAILQRRVAERLTGPLGLGTDRVILSATHTHAAPGHLYETANYNEQAGALPGFDPRWTEFLIEQMVRSVRAAVDSLAEAKAAWGSVRVPGVTVNRSMDAYVRNDPRVSPDSVDDSLVMLRVDRCPGMGACVPVGAFSVFAVHGTGNPAANALLDGDVHSVVERRLERHIDSLNGLAPGPATRAFHLFANGTEGDVSPRYPPTSRCETHLRFRMGRRPSGPRTPLPAEEWRASAEQVHECLEVARRSVDSLGGAIGDAAVSLFDSLGDRLGGGLPVARAFASLDLLDRPSSDSLCAEPRSGTSNFGGAEDGRTRLFKWKILGFIPTGFEEGGMAIDPGHNSRNEGARCHGAKRIALGFFLQGVLAGEHGFPEHAQLSAVRVGNTLVGFVPWEVTTEAGARIKDAMLAEGPDGTERAVVVSLSNGYVQYLTTAEEYGQQTYEGGSNIYGPYTARFVARQMARLAGGLSTRSPIVEVDTIIAYPGDSITYLREAGSAFPGFARRVESIACRDGVMTARWIDGPPGTLFPADGPVLEIRDGSTRVAWDDMSAVVVRAVGPQRGGRFLWEVTWRSERPLGAGHRLTLLPRPGFDEVAASCP